MRSILFFIMALLQAAACDLHFLDNIETSAGSTALPEGQQIGDLSMIQADLSDLREVQDLTPNSIDLPFSISYGNMSCGATITNNKTVSIGIPSSPDRDCTPTFKLMKPDSQSFSLSGGMTLEFDVNYFAHNYTDSRLGLRFYDNIRLWAYIDNYTSRIIGVFPGFDTLINNQEKKEIRSFHLPIADGPYAGIFIEIESRSNNGHTTNNFPSDVIEKPASITINSIKLLR